MLLGRLPPKVIVSILVREHPQTIAIALSFLEAKKRGEVLKDLPTEIRTQVLQRSANIRAVADDLLQDMTDALREATVRVEAGTIAARGGSQSIAKMLGTLDKEAVKALLSGLATRDPDLADRVQEQMFTFDDLARLSDQDIRLVLNEIKPDVLRVALRGAAAQVQDRIFANMSERRTRQLQEDIAEMGKVKVGDVKAAQSTILRRVLALAAAGTISLNIHDQAV